MTEEMFRAVIEAGQSAIKSALLINGGAATALLAVLAEGLKSPDTELRALVPAISWAWLVFVVGLGSAGTCSAARYLSQHYYGEADRRDLDHARHNASGDAWRRTAVGLGLSSFLLFFLGTLLAFAAFRGWIGS